MMYTEIIKDLFSADPSYYLAHCISSDAKMGAGIAVDFKKRFKLGHMTENAKKQPYPVGSCIQVGRVLNLITKKFFYGKPTYDSLELTLNSMKKVALQGGILKIAMPQIGAGLDRLSWAKNREIINRFFEDTNIEILVCIKV
ncbi:macro domain-containing protein [Paenibacillus sinopodophylli]|uniref:macro domain-containing protein n=1 Tax=Paenibacillus sinopodophylli TaxID=1837342 RepID=UPI00110CCA7B|nr:macro domain-containing protein [Paenibacillus sinopodophylli]